MPLNDSICKNAKPKERPYKLSDSGGLYLQVMPSGAKYWRMKYRYLGREKLLAVGKYPFTSLADAREDREKAKKQLKALLDPSTEKKRERRVSLINRDNTFKAIALEWCDVRKETWSEGYYENILHRLNKEIFPFIGNDPIAKIETPDLLFVLKKIERRKAYDLALRCRQICIQVFRYGIQIGKCKTNPAISLHGALKTRKRKHFAAITSDEIPELIAALKENNARLFPRTRRAINLSMLTFVRPGELRQAEWSEIDFEKKVWIIPAEKMKSRREHMVPLCDQAIAILKEQKEETGHYNTKYVFPSQIKPKEPMSDNTIRVALQKLGFKDRLTAHGFRALARTTIREELNYEPDIIEAQLAHKPAGPLGAAYDRSQFIKQRTVMMQQWADFLDSIAMKNKPNAK